MGEMNVKSTGPVVLHVLTGVAWFALLATSPRCGEDECLRTLFLVVSGAMWSALLLPIVFLAKRRRTASQVLSWCIAVLWAPLAWATAFALFIVAPGLGGA
jgi:hypothetical protein